MKRSLLPTMFVLLGLCMTVGGPPTLVIAEVHTIHAESVTTPSTVQVHPLSSFSIPMATILRPDPQDPALALFRQVPTITGRVSMGDTTLMPYLGAGFGGGFASDLNRATTRDSASSSQDDRSLRDLLGKNLVPNEVHVGIRIPF